MTAKFCRCWISGQFCWISSTGNKSKNRIYHWKKDAFFLRHSLFVDAGALSLNQDEKILSSDNFFQLSRTTKTKKILLCNEAVLFADDLTNKFDVSISFLGFLLLLFSKSYLCEGGCEIFLWNNTLCVQSFKHF